MYFELQLSADVFTRIVRNRMKAIPLCVDREFRDAQHNVQLVVDRIVVGENTTIRREKEVDPNASVELLLDSSTQTTWIFSPTNLSAITVPYLQVRQDVAIYLVKSPDLDANGPNPSPASQTLVIYPVFNVSLKPANPGQQGGGPIMLSYELAHVEFGLLFGLLTKDQRVEITSLLSSVKVDPMTVDLAALSTLMQRPVNAINAGIACDPDGTFVALRADIDVYASPAEVESAFFQAGPTNLLTGKEWAMLVDADLLTQDGARQAKKALETAAKVRLVSGPDASWDAAATTIAISASLELVDACPFLVDNIDMDVDVDIRAAFSVSPTNVLRTHYAISGTPSDAGEEFLCAVTGALLWPFIGPVMLKDTDLDEGFGIYLAGLAMGPIPLFFGILGYIEMQKAEVDEKKMGPTCKKVDDDIECTEDVNIQMMLIPPFTARLNLETAYGVAEGLVLAGTIVNLGNTPVGDSEVAVSPFEWTLVGGCRPIGSPGFAIVNQAEITVDPVYQKGYPVKDADFCKAYILTDSDPLKEFALVPSVGKVTVRPQFNPDYLAAPYPCRIRVVMARGRGVRTITLAPPAALGDEQRAHLERLRANFIGVCLKWADTFRKPEKVGWKIPGPVEKESIHLWQIAARGMNPQDVIRVDIDEGHTVLNARPSASGVAHFSLMLPADRAPSGLALELKGPREPGDRARALSVQQVVFERRAALPVRGPVRTLSFERDGGRRHLIIADRDREMTWDVTVPSAPALLSSLARSGNEDAGQIVVHTGKRVGAEPTKNLLVALDRLRSQLGRIEAVGSLRVSGVAETLYVRTGKGATLYDISQPYEPRELHVYEAPAWHEGVAVGGKLMARVDAESSVVVLYVATATDLQ